MAIKDWNGFKKSGDTYIPNDATARAGVTATVDLLKDTTGWTGKNEVDVTKYNHISTNCVASASGDDVMTFTAPTTATGNYAELSYYASQTSDVLFDHNEARKMLIIVTALTSNKAAIGVRNSESRFIKTLKFESTGTYILDLSDVAEDYYVGVYPRWEYNNAEASMTFKLMVYDARLDDTYEPYHDTVEEVKADKTGVISALDNTVGWIGKNHLNSDDYNVYNAGNSNITATPYYNSDGHIEKIRLNGQTGSGSGNFAQVQFSQRGNVTAIILEQKDYVFSVGNAIPTGCRLQAGYTNPSTGSYTPVLDSSTDGALFTSPTDTQKWTIQLVINAGITLTDYDVYPMLTDPEQYALSPSFEPYHESVELSKYNRSEANILGAKNRMNFPAWKGVATTDATVSWDDDTYTLTLTSSANGGRTNITVPEAAQIDVIPNERIKFVWDSTGSDDSTMGFDIYKVGDVSAPIASASVHDNQLVFTVPANCTKITYRAYSNSANKVIKMANCMCLCAEDTDLTFKKFTMTNRELTDAVTPKKLEETSTSEQAARITVPTSFRIAYVFVSLDSDKTFQCVIVKGISSRAFRFTYKASSNAEVRGYIWYDYTNSRIEVGSFMVNDVEMKNDTNIKLEVFYI